MWKSRADPPNLKEVLVSWVPNICTPPSDAHASNQRRLRQGSSDEKALSELAYAACAHLATDHNMHKNCIVDVMATGDDEVAAMVYGGVW
jgi:hypothetical protein